MPKLLSIKKQYQEAHEHPAPPRPNHPHSPGSSVCSDYGTSSGKVGEAWPKDPELRSVKKQISTLWRLMSTVENQTASLLIITHHIYSSHSQDLLCPQQGHSLSITPYHPPSPISCLSVAYLNTWREWGHQGSCFITSHLILYRQGSH